MATSSGLEGPPPIPDDDDGEDDIIYLPEAPIHLRRVSNQANPILISSDNETSSSDSDSDSDSDQDTEDDDFSSKETITANDRRKRKGKQKDKHKSKRRKKSSPVAEKYMDIVFDDEEVQHIPLGWGGLGIPQERDNEPPIAGPSRRPQTSNVVVEIDSSRHLKHGRNSSRSTKSRSKSKSKSNSRSRSREHTACDPFSYLATPAQDYSPLSAEILLPRVLEVLPDLCPKWALATLQTKLEAGLKEAAVELTMHAALEMDNYPVAIVEASGDRSQISKEVNYKSLTYRVDQRKGWGYNLYSTSALADYFPSMPHAHIQNVLGQFHLLVPSYFALLKDSLEDPKPYTDLKRARTTKSLPKRGQSISRLPSTEDPIFRTRVTSSGIGTSASTIANSRDLDDGAAEFWKEKEWLDEFIANEKSEADAKKVKEAARDEILANGGGIECGCCFGEEIWEEMFQCSEGHLFCRDCLNTYVENKLGEEQHIMKCFDQSNCAACFSESELVRLLSTKSLSLYHRLQQASELEAADISGLESCPFCPFRMIIEDPEEKIFRCLGPGCMTISCRKCKEKNHIPKSCEEVAADKKANKRHLVEDAMTEALVRKCPKCKRPYVKEDGCNKITCHKCGALSCYQCQELVVGYDHFDQGIPLRPGQPPPTKRKCILHDQNERMNDINAVIAARDAAQIRVREDAAAEGVELSEEDLNVPAPDIGSARAPRVQGLQALEQALRHEAIHVMDPWLEGLEGVPLPNRLARHPLLNPPVGRPLPQPEFIQHRDPIPRPFDGYPMDEHRHVIYRGRGFRRDDEEINERLRQVRDHEVQVHDPARAARATAIGGAMAAGPRPVIAHRPLQRLPAQPLPNLARPHHHQNRVALQ